MYVGEGPVVSLLNQVGVLVSLWAVFVFLGFGAFFSGFRREFRLISTLSV